MTFFERSRPEMDGVQKVRKSGHFSGKSDFFEFSRGGTRVWTTFFDLVLGFPLGFPRFFRKFWVFRGFPGFSGVPVIKEGKAIALRTIDMLLCIVVCAMQWSQVLYVEVPVFPGKWVKKRGQKVTIFNELWAVNPGSQEGPGGGSLYIQGNGVGKSSVASGEPSPR